jgi:glycosyltransferase involved in cell wall biosynthesis
VNFHFSLSYGLSDDIAYSSYFMKLIDSKLAAVGSKSRARSMEQSFLAAAPLLPDVGVLALVPDRWHWQWQPRHQVMTRLARYFTVVWMNPAEYWRDSFRPNKFLAPREEMPIPEPGFAIHTSSPFLPALFSPRWLAQSFLRKRLENARQVLLSRGCKKIVLYLWRPDFASALDLISFDLSCYHIDDEYSFSSVDIPNSEAESCLIARADQVFIHSPALLEKKGQINLQTAFAPNGVDFLAYARPVPEPADIAGIPHPRIGYSGRLKKQLDWALLLDLATRHPEWFFVFVGAVNPHPEIAAYIDQLSRRPNVRFLGSKTAQELATYPQHFDVCVMPYLRDDYTKYIYPLKLHEYLASGRPAVGTPIASLEAFRDVVRLPETRDQWSAAIAESLGPAANSGEQRMIRQALAKKYDWEILARRIAETMASRLGPEYSSRITREPAREVDTSPDASRT